MHNTRSALAYLDVIFLNRNKGYGAYELRTNYPSRLRKAIGAVLFSVGLLGLLPLLGAALFGKESRVATAPMLDTTVIDRIPVKKIKPIIEPEPANSSKPVATQKVTPPKIVADERATEENVLQQVDTSRLIASDNREGRPALPDESGTSGNGTGPGRLVESGGTKPAADAIETIVDIQAVFPGDVREYLANKLQYPDQAREAGIEGRVVVRFVVDEEGAISRASVVRSIGGGCDEEALRVIRSMPRWKPAKLNGQVVKSYFSLPIKFTLED